MSRRPPRATRTDPLVPDTKLCRSAREVRCRNRDARKASLAFAFARRRVRAAAGGRHHACGTAPRTEKAGTARAFRDGQTGPGFREPRFPLRRRYCARRTRSRTDVAWRARSEEHTSEIQSLMRTSYDFFFL